MTELNNKDVAEEEPLNDNNENKIENKTLKQKLCYLKSNISVEPILAGLVISGMIAKLAVYNLNLDKACRVKLNYDDEICDSLINKNGNFSHYEAKVQKVIASIETWKSVVQTGVPTILIIFMGAWSDITGNRKVCILLPILGDSAVCICNILSTYFFYEIPVEMTMFLEAFFPAITGGSVMLYLGVFSYISDITNSETRTYRIGLANLCLTAGVPIGSALSGILLKSVGFYGVFTISGFVYLLTFTYGVVYLKNNTKPGASENTEKKSINIISLIKETADIAFKKRDGNTRKKILLTFLVVAIIYGPSHGERIIVYLFTRYRLKWDAVQYSLYSTYGIIVHSIGALFSITMFSKRWGFHDSMMCLISVVSKLAGSLCTAFVQTDLHMFMVPLVEILNATTFTSLRSMASKLVPSNEMGKANSLFSLVETLAALIFDPTYTTLYGATVENMTGAVFLYSSALTLPPISILTWFFVTHRKERRIELNNKTNDLKLNENLKEKNNV